MRKFFGDSICEGIAIGKAVYMESGPIVSNFISVSEEKRRLSTAIESLYTKLSALFDSMKSRGMKYYDMIRVHLTMLEDQNLIDELKRNISSRVSAEESTSMLLNKYIEKADPNDLLAKNLSSLSDLFLQLKDELRNSRYDYEKINDKILLSREVSVSQLLDLLNREIKIRGVALSSGGKNSHTSILLKDFGIPSLIMVPFGRLSKSDDYTILDSRLSFESLIVDPDETTKSFYLKLLDFSDREKENLLKFNIKNVHTKDGQRVETNISLNHLKDLKGLGPIEYDGLGMLRTEFFFISSGRFPNQDEQLSYYEKLLPHFQNKKICIRLADLGFDKNLSDISYSEIYKSSLGVRGARFLLKNPAMLQAQFKAILRFSSRADVTIIYPFITNVNEVVSLNKILESCKEDLVREGCNFDPETEIACLIETPASAIVADQIIDLVDRLVIGVNDLAQYVLAASRNSTEVEYLYDFFDPALLRLIKGVLDSAKEKGKGVAVCGEMLHNSIGVAALLILGARNLSFAPGYILRAKKIISRLDLSKTEDLENYLLKEGTAETNKSMLSMVLNDVFAEI